MAKEALVWTLPNCVSCNRTKTWLDNKGVNYTELDLTEPESAEDLAYFKSLGHTQGPIVEIVDTDVEYGWMYHTDLWSGFNVEKLEEHFG